MYVCMYVCALCVYVCIVCSMYVCTYEALYVLYVCMYYKPLSVNMYVCICMYASYGGFENGAHHHVRLGEISPAEQDEVVEDVVEIVDSLAQLEAGRYKRLRWPALVVLGVEAGGVRSEEIRHCDVHLSVAIL